VQAILADAHAQYRAGNATSTRAFLCLLTLRVQSPADLWQTLGHLRYALGQYEPAGVAYGYAAAYRPRDAALQARLALTCLALGDLPSFHAYRRRARSLDPQNLTARQPLQCDLRPSPGQSC
jgi:tetratricopeptide (TPR) repeat protein